MRSDTRYDMYRQSALLAKWTPDVSANEATGKKTVQERRAGSEKAGERYKNWVIETFNQGGVAWKIWWLEAVGDMEEMKRRVLKLEVVRLRSRDIFLKGGWGLKKILAARWQSNGVRVPCKGASKRVAALFWEVRERNGRANTSSESHFFSRISRGPFSLS